MQPALSSVSVATCDEELPEVESPGVHRPPSNDHRLIHLDRVGSICEPAQSNCYLILALLDIQRNLSISRFLSV